MNVLVFVAGWLGALLAASRWLRVAQREHYLTGSVLRFAVRWWRSAPVNQALIIAGVTTVVASTVIPSMGLITAIVAAVGPVGLAIRGRTSPLAWTDRLRRLAVVTGLAMVGWSFGAVALGAPGLVGGSGMVMPVLVALALAAARPLEARRGDRWVRRAATSLKAAAPTVVAITGSYGKTSTKGHVAHLLKGTRRVVASPASFNNRMGLARSVNENLTPGTEVFVAEMGTYGPGEIAELCRWIPPDVAVITAIGPVHLERMGSEERIVAAKREILTKGAVAVINVDHPLLADVASEERVAGRRVVTCGTREPAEVVADPATLEVHVRHELVGRFPSTVHAGNVACAVGVCRALGVDLGSVGPRLGSLADPPHRRTITTGDTGVLIIDDTFNSNPAGARAALAALAAVPDVGRRVVVSPGMIELGTRQDEENAAFAREAAAFGCDLLVVGRTNRDALLAGALAGGLDQGIVVSDRDEAVAWVRAHLGAGDAVLYENDLPDHYP